MGNQLNWPSNNQSLYEGLLTDAGPIGAAIGSFLGSKIASRGRRLAFFYGDIIVLIGSGVSMIENMASIWIGRFIYGFSCGIFSVLVPLFINEVAPLELAGSLGAVNQFMVTFGSLVATLVALPVPDPGSEAEATSNYWRIMFGVPVIVAAVQALLFFCVFRTETPRFLLSRGREESTRGILGQLYGEANASSALMGLNPKSSELSNLRGTKQDRQTEEDEVQVETRVPCARSANATSRFCAHPSCLGAPTLQPPRLLPLHS